MKQRLWLALVPGRIQISRAFEIFYTQVESGGFASVDFRNLATRINARFKQNKTVSTPTIMGQWVFDFATVDHCGIDWVSICSELISDQLSRGVVWEFYIEKALIMGVLLDHEYDYWQNAEDPLQYSSVGRSMKGLPTRSNGLPPPLAQTIVDISKNPGRRTVRQGYIEAVGSRVWLGSEFKARMINEIEADLRFSEFTTEFLDGGLLEVRAPIKGFASTAGESPELQNFLRQVLFNQ